MNILHGLLLSLFVSSAFAACGCNPTTEACCGGTTCYSLATQGCCNGQVFTNATDFCCSSAGGDIICANNQTCGTPDEQGAGAFCFASGLSLCSTDVAHSTYNASVDICCNGNRTGNAVLMPRTGSDDACCYDAGTNAFVTFNSATERCCASCDNPTAGASCTTICSQSDACSNASPPTCVSNTGVSCLQNGTTCDEINGFFPTGGWGCCDASNATCSDFDACFEEDNEICCGLRNVGGCLAPSMCTLPDACMVNACTGLGTCYDADQSAVCTDANGCSQLYSTNNTICCAGTLLGKPDWFCCNNTAFETTTGDACCGVTVYTPSADVQCCGGELVASTRVCCNDVACQDGEVCSDGSCTSSNTTAAATATTTGTASTGNATTTGAVTTSTNNITTTTASTTGTTSSSTTGAVTTTGTTVTTTAVTSSTTSACTDTDSTWVSILFKVPTGNTPDEVAIEETAVGLLNNSGVDPSLVVFESLQATGSNDEWLAVVRVCGDSARSSKQIADIVRNTYNDNANRAELAAACGGCTVVRVSTSSQRPVASVARGLAVMLSLLLGSAAFAL